MKKPDGRSRIYPKVSNKIHKDELGQYSPQDEEELMNKDEQEWAYENGALNKEEALTLISNHKRSIGS